MTQPSSQLASRYVQPIHYRTYPGGLLEVTQAVSIENEFGWRVDIPKGFITDGASIPRLLWPLIGHPFQGDFLQAAVYHDLLCHHAWLLGSYQHRVMADAFFFWLLTELKIPLWKRTAMYLAVRMWGRWSYRPRSVEHYLEVTHGETDFSNTLSEEIFHETEHHNDLSNDDEDFGFGLLDDLEPEQLGGSSAAA